MAWVVAHPILSAAVALEATSQIQQGVAANQQAKYNAQVAEMRAEQARRAAELQRYRIERRKRRMLAHQRALYAKAGVTFEGSPLEVMADTAAQFDLDKAISKYNEQTAVSRNMYEAGFQRYAGRQRMTAGFLRAGGTLLQGSSYLRGMRKPTYGSYDYWHSRGLASTPPYSISF